MARRRKRRNSGARSEKTEVSELQARGSGRKASGAVGELSYDSLEGVYSPSALSASPAVSRNWTRSAVTTTSRTNTWGINASAFMFPNFYGSNRSWIDTGTATDTTTSLYMNKGPKLITGTVVQPIFSEDIDNLMAQEVYDVIRTKTRQIRYYTINDIKHYLRLAFMAYCMEISLRYLYYLSSTKFPGLLDLGGRFADALASTYSTYGWTERADIEARMKQSQIFMSTYFLPPKLMAYAHWLSASYWLYDNELSPVGMYYNYGDVGVPNFASGLAGQGGTGIYDHNSNFCMGSSLLDRAESDLPYEYFPVQPDTAAGNSWIKRMLVTDLYHVYGESSRMLLPDWEMCAPKIDTAWTALWRNSPSAATYGDGEVTGRVTVPPLAGVADQFAGSTTVTLTPDDSGTLPWFGTQPPSALEAVSWGLSFPILSTIDTAVSTAANYYLEDAINRTGNYSMGQWSITKLEQLSESDTNRANARFVLDVFPPALVALIDQNAYSDLNTVGVDIHAIGNGAIWDYRGDDSVSASPQFSLTGASAYYTSLMLASERIWMATWGSASLPTSSALNETGVVWAQGLAPLYQPRREGHPFLMNGNVIRNASFEFAANIVRD